ncbi:hypothetical protein JW868_03095 [Candidatus Woesearchaeota archaeon]|nr:hypothetical protein [Candidatus Woesearchaeota archaeon]
MVNVQKEYQLSVHEIEEIKELLDKDLKLREDIKEKEQEIHDHIARLIREFQQVYEKVKELHKGNPDFIRQDKYDHFDEEKQEIERGIELIMSNIQNWKSGPGSQAHVYLENISNTCKFMIAKWLLFLGSGHHDEHTELREMRGKGAVILKAIRFIADRDYQLHVDEKLLKR